MELLGGVMIMLVLLTLMLGAVWLSLPFLIIGLGRRLERTAGQLDRIEARLDAFERRGAPQEPPPVAEATMTTATAQEGVDGTA